MAFNRGVAQQVGIVCYDGETPTNPTNPVVTVSTDGGTFNAAANSPTVVTPGLVLLELSSDEMSGAVVGVKVASDNLEEQIAVCYTEEAYTPARAAEITTIAGDVAGLDGAAMRGTNGAYTGTPPSAADIATAVWSAGSRTLSSFGSLVADVAAAVWAAANRTLSVFGFTPNANVTSVGGTVVAGPDAFKADVSGIPAAVDAALTAAHDAGSWGAGAGTGSKAVTIKLAGDDGAPAVGVTFTLKNADQSADIGTTVTGSDGEGAVAFGLEAETDYVVVARSNTAWQFAATTITTGESTEAETITVTGTAFAPTPPPDADYCTVYGWEETVAGSPGAGSVRASVPSGTRRGAGAAAVGLFPADVDVAALNEAGYWELAVLRGAVVDFRLRLTNGQGWQYIGRRIPAAASANVRELAVG